jgi:hypothetical protein
LRAITASAVNKQPVLNSVASNNSFSGQHKAGQNMHKAASRGRSTPNYSRERRVQTSNRRRKRMHTKDVN